MKPFCTLGYGQTFFSEPATPAEDTTSLVSPALLVPGRSDCNRGRISVSIPPSPRAKFGTLHGFCKLMKFCSLTGTHQSYPNELLPELTWVFVRSTGSLQSYLSLFSPVELKEIWQLLKVFVSVSLSFLSFALSL